MVKNFLLKFKFKQLVRLIEETEDKDYGVTITRKTFNDDITVSIYAPSVEVDGKYRSRDLQIKMKGKEVLTIVSFHLQNEGRGAGTRVFRWLINYAKRNDIKRIVVDKVTTISEQANALVNCSFGYFRACLDERCYELYNEDYDRALEYNIARKNGEIE